MTNAEKLEYAFKALEDTTRYLKDNYLFACPLRAAKKPCYICDRMDVDYLKDELKHLLRFLNEDDEDNNNQPPS